MQNILPVGKICALNLCKAFHHPLIEMVVEVNWGNHPIYLRSSGLTFYFHLLPKYKATQDFCDALKKTKRWSERTLIRSLIIIWSSCQIMSTVKLNLYSIIYHLTSKNFKGLNADQSFSILKLLAVKKTNLDISKCFIYEAVMKYFLAKISSNYEVICEFFQGIRSD